ncbi:MAG TPA: thioredoxin [Anaerolineales bacterium]|nr:thioredoxin [Anaerolineales bacterium]
MKTPVHVNDNTFDGSVLKSNIPVLVDFWAPWCGPCKMIAPVLEKLAAEYDGRLTVAKVNTDENARWSMQYGVQGIPTLLLIRDGKEADRIVGAAPLSMIKAKIEKLLGD